MSNRPFVWPAHALVWIEAAMTLPRKNRGKAFRDIAAMLGCSQTAVETRATRIRREAESELAWVTSPAHRPLPIQTLPEATRFINAARSRPRPPIAILDLNES